jgi:hypothetical protein
MFGFGIILMHLADYYTRRKYDKKRRRQKEKEEQAEDKQVTAVK